MTDQPYGPTPQQKKQLVDLLVAAELHQYLSSLNSQLNVNTVRQLKAVSDDDFVTVLGMSKPEVRRLRKFIKKMAGQSGTLEKIKNILSKSTHETSELCCLPVTDKSPTSFLIDQSDITISKELGRGTFGSVHSGTWITSSGSKLPIAARKMALFMTEQTRDGFLSSAQSLHLLKHNNIVRLFGVSMTTSHLFMVMEQAPGGQSLRSWLQLPRPSSATPIQLIQLIEFSRQICSALTFLEGCKFVHGDVSGRNVLVFSEELVKVADPGLRAALDPESQSLKSLVDEEPEKLAWFAPECLESLHVSTFSTSSDVWSFGVTMWEVFSQGAVPSWNASGSAQLLSAMKSGKTLERPATCPRDFHSVMTDCWKLNPLRRPTFQQLYARLGKLNLVRLQVETDPTMTAVGGMEDQLVIKTGDVVTVIDSSSTCSPVVGWWKGLNESTNQVGFFNPVNMKPLSGSEAFRQPVAKQQTGSSGVLRRGKMGQQKPKLTAGMISLPLNDLRHTSHVGRDGETFGCEMLPIHQVATPVSDQWNSESMRSERSSALSSTVSISSTTTATLQESDSRKKRDPPARQNSKPPLSTGSDKMLNGSYRAKDGSPTSGSSKERSSIPLVSKLSVGSNLSGDILTRVRYSPSSISMVSADLSHVTSLVSSDTLTDVSSLPGDIGSLSKSDYEDYECMEGENDETFDVTNTDVDEAEDHPHDDTIVCCTDDDRDGQEEEEDEDAEEDDSPQTIEEPRTPKILDTSSSLFDEVMFALGGAQQPNKRMLNGHPKNKKKAIFAVGDSEICCEAMNSSNGHVRKSKTTQEATKALNTLASLPVRNSDETEDLELAETRAEASEDNKDVAMFRTVNGRQHQAHVNVCDSSFTNSSTISLMSSCSDLKSSNSSLDAAHGRVSVLSKISNALGRSRSKDTQRRFSQASTASRLSVALTNVSITTGEQDASNSKLSSSSFSGFDGKKTKVIALDSLPVQQDKYPSFLPSKSRSLKSSKAKDKLRRSSLILASVFQGKRDDKHRRPVLPVANFNTNELFFNKLREQEQEIAEQAEEDSRRLREEEGESEDSGVALHFLNQSQEAVPSQENTDDGYANTSPNDSKHEIKKDSLKITDYCLNNTNNEMNQCLKDTSSEFSDILSELNLNSSQNQERPMTFLKSGIHNGRSLKDLTSTSQNGRKLNGIQESVGRELPPDYSSKTLPKRALRDTDRRVDILQNNNIYKVQFEFEYPVQTKEYEEEEPHRAKGDPLSFRGGKPTLVRTCSSGSDSPDVVDV